MRHLILSIALMGCTPIPADADTGDLLSITADNDEETAGCTVEVLIGTCEDGEVTTGLMPGATLISLLELDEDGASDELTPEQVFLDPEEEASRVNLTAACTDDYRIRASIIWCR